MSTPPNPELTDAHAKLAGVLKKLRKASDPDDIDYYRHIAGEWRKYIEGLEKKHGRETTLQPLNQPGELPARGD